MVYEITAPFRPLPPKGRALLEFLAEHVDKVEAWSSAQEDRRSWRFTGLSSGAEEVLKGHQEEMVKLGWKIRKSS